MYDRDTHMDKCGHTINLRLPFYLVSHLPPLKSIKLLPNSDETFDNKNFPKLGQVQVVAHARPKLTHGNYNNYYYII